MKIYSLKAIVLLLGFFSAYSQYYPKSFSQTLLDAVVAGNITEVKRLTKQSSLIEIMDLKGCTLLHYAIFNQKLDTSLYLIEAGLGMDTADRYGVTPLHLLALKSDFGFFSTIVKQAKKLRWDVRDVGGATPLHYAAARGSYDIALLILKEGMLVDVEDYWGVTPLHLAANNDHDSLLSMLISRGAKANKVDKRELSALHKAVLSGAFKSVKILARVSGALELKDRDFNTPLHFAVIRGDEKIMSWLLAVCKANPEQANRSGKTPLHFAVLLNRYEMAKLLLRHSADVNVKDQRNYTPIDYARLMQNQKLIDLLLEKAV